MDLHTIELVKNLDTDGGPSNFGSTSSLHMCIAHGLPHTYKFPASASHIATCRPVSCLVVHTVNSASQWTSIIFLGLFSVRKGKTIHSSSSIEPCIDIHKGWLKYGL